MRSSLPLFSFKRSVSVLVRQVDKERRPLLPGFYDLLNTSGVEFCRVVPHGFPSDTSVVSKVIGGIVRLSCIVHRKRTGSLLLK